MVLNACGYKVKPETLNELQDFLASRKSTKLDFNGLQAVLTQIKSCLLYTSPSPRD